VSGNSAGKRAIEVSASSDGRLDMEDNKTGPLPSRNFSNSVEAGDIGAYELSGSSKTRADVEDNGLVELADANPADDDAYPGVCGSNSFVTRRWLASNSSCVRSRIFIAVSIAFWKLDARPEVSIFR